MEYWHWVVLALAVGYLALRWAVRNWVAVQPRKPVSVEDAVINLADQVAECAETVADEFMPMLEDAMEVATDLLREYEQQRHDD